MVVREAAPYSSVQAVARVVARVVVPEAVPYSSVRAVARVVVREAAPYSWVRAAAPAGHSSARAPPSGDLQVAVRGCRWAWVAAWQIPHPHPHRHWLHRHQG